MIRNLLRSIRWLPAVFAASTPFTISSHAQSFETFEPLGAASSGGVPSSHAISISADGTAILGHTTLPGFATAQYFIWRSDTGMFIVTNGLEHVRGVDVANGGNRAVFESTRTAEDWGITRALLWTRTNGLQLIGRLTDGPARYVEPAAISANGEVIVGRANSTNAPRTFLDWEAFQWSGETGIVGLGDIMGDPQRDAFWSQAVGVSGDGRVIAGTVRYSGSEDSLHGHYAPARWVDGVGPQILGASPHGDLDYGALGISANGRFIIAASSIGAFEDTRHYVLRWSEDQGYTILYEGPGRFTPRDISDDGLVVVGDGDLSDDHSDSERGAMIWTPELGVRPLRDALIQLGVDLPPFTFKTAPSISADGRVIVGGGADVNNHTRGYRVALWELPPRKIIVNSLADRPMLSAANCCDTGETLPNGDVECTLRAAIEAVNAGCGDRIEFAVPEVSIARISPQSPLPPLQVKVAIDGTTQSGGKVEISGTESTGICLDLQGGSSSVRGLVINNFTGPNGVGIRLSGGGKNLIAGNYIGTDVSGNIRAINVVNIVITNSSNNQIGTTKPGEGNVIGDLVIIAGDGSTGNAIVANRIGIGADGQSEIGRNLGVGVWGGAGATVGGNYIGGLSDFAVQVAASRDTIVEGNFIGLDVRGTRGLGGEIGIVGAGPTGSGVSNLIIRSNRLSGVRAGIVIVGSKVTGAQVIDNVVGLSFDGSGALPSGVDANYTKFGIRVDGAPNVQVLRNFVTGADINLMISGKPQVEYIPCEDTDGDGLCNTASQVRFYSPENPKTDDSAFPIVGGAIIGANTLGLNDKFAVPAGAKQRFGVVVYRGARDLQLRNNIIAGHSESDVWLRDGVRLQLMQNRIGTGEGITRGSQIGITVDETSDVTIAPSGAFLGNTISLQKKAAILVRSGATNLLVRQNQFGTGPGGAVAWPNGSGIVAAGLNVPGLRIENNLINASVTNALSLELPGHKVVLQGNRIGVSSSGLALSNRVGVVIKNTAVELRDNTIAHNGAGIVISGGQPALIQGGPLYQNGDGSPQAAFTYHDQAIPQPSVFVAFKVKSPAGKINVGFTGMAISQSGGEVEIEIYGNRAGEKQGRTPLGRRTVKANESFEFVLEGEPGSALDTLPEFSATATQNERTSMLAAVKPILLEAKPVVTATTSTDISLQWPAVLPLTLERANTSSGPWVPVLTRPTVVDDIATVTLPLEGDSQFFRLVLEN